MLQYCPPLRERVFRSHSSIQLSVSTGPRGQYKAWTELQMSRAFSAVVSEGMSVRKAASEYNVPKSSLADRVSGRVMPGTKSGPPMYLTVSEETELVQFLTRCAGIGYGKSRKEVIALVQRILDKKGILKMVTNGWWESFCHRHPNISLRSGASLSLARARASDPEMVSRYFDLLERTLKENDLIGKPGQVFNMDESGMPLDPKTPKVVAEQGSATVVVGSGNKSQVTIVGCCSAAGFCMPPMVIWDRKTLAPQLTIGEVPGTIYGLSGSGWMDMELFDMWFQNHFLRYAPSARPILLLLDGHSSHYCPDTIRLAAWEKIILFALPPNTTHLSQPLDRGCFGPLKVSWREECHRYMSENPGKVVTKFQFSPIFSKAWARSMIVANITAGFRVTGVYPLNRHAFSLPSYEVKDLSQETGLSFIPMYSPISRRPSKRDAHEFTEEEVTLFEKRYESGYDLTGATAVSSFLSYPSPPARAESFKPKSCRRVLTSSENLAIMEEKEREKKEKQKEREEARKKKAAKAEEMERKKRARKECISDKSDEFTEEEVTLFETRYENGYDLTDDKIYNRWLTQNHPESTVHPLQYRSTAVSSFLSYPSPPARVESFKPKSCGRVLTSSENLAIMEEKEREKKEKQKEREEARKKKAAKAEEMEREKKEKQKEREEARKKKAAKAEEMEREKKEKQREREEARKKKAAEMEQNKRARKECISDKLPKTQQRSLRSSVSKTQGVTQRSRLQDPGESISERDPPTHMALRPKEQHSRPKGLYPRLGESIIDARGKQSRPSNKDQKSASKTEDAAPKTQEAKKNALSNTQDPMEQFQSPEPRGALRGRQGPGGQSPMPLSRSQGVVTVSCIDGNCSHPRAVNWVQCGGCFQWYHCVCVGLSARKARSGEFTCCS